MEPRRPVESELVFAQTNCVYNICTYTTRKCNGRKKYPRRELAAEPARARHSSEKTELLLLCHLFLIISYVHRYVRALCSYVVVVLPRSYDNIVRYCIIRVIWRNIKYYIGTPMSYTHIYVPIGYRRVNWLGRARKKKVGKKSLHIYVYIMRCTPQLVRLIRYVRVCYCVIEKCV